MLTISVSKQENVTFLPMDTVAGSVFVEKVPDQDRAVMRCGNHDGTCGNRFVTRTFDLRMAHVRGENVYCPDCTPIQIKDKIAEIKAARARKRKTAKDIILDAAIALAGPKLTAEIPLVDLYLTAWKLAPKTFGVPGYEESYPDTNRVKMEICNRKMGGLMDLYLERPKPNVYRFTMEGRERVRREQRRAANEQAQACAGGEGPP